MLRLPPLQSVALTLAVFASGSEFARAHDPVCDHPSFRKVEVPFFPRQPDSDRFAYSYQLIERKPGAPTIVYMPGGPGPGSSQDLDSERGRAFLESMFPADVNILLTDPRTAACNWLEGTIPKSSLTTDSLAHDVVAAIRHAGLTDYALYGMSYGTQLATQVAALLETSGLPKPSVIVLAGTVGKGGVETSVAKGVLAEWKLYRSELSAKALERLSNPEAYNLDSRRLASYLQMSLTRGLYVEKGQKVNLLKSAFALLESDDPADLEALKDLIEKRGTPVGRENYFSDVLFSALSCRELSNWEPELELIAGDMVPGSHDECAGVALGELFDPAQYLYSSRTVYVQGERDPATPPQGGRYHFMTRSAPSVFISVPDSGHRNVATTFGDCQDSFWQASLRGQPLEPALSSCILSHKIEERTP